MDGRPGTVRWSREGVQQNNLKQEEGGQDYQQVICLPVFVRTCEDTGKVYRVQAIRWRILIAPVQ